MQAAFTMELGRGSLGLCQANYFVSLRITLRRLKDSPVLLGLLSSSLNVPPVEPGCQTKPRFGSRPRCPRCIIPLRVVNMSLSKLCTSLESTKPSSTADLRNAFASHSSSSAAQPMNTAYTSQMHAAQERNSSDHYLNERRPVSLDSNMSGLRSDKLNPVSRRLTGVPSAITV